MTKNGTPRGRIVRRLGINIFGNPKYDRLLARKPAGPGKAPGSRQRKRSDFAVQLVEKQKYRDAYGLGERQFRNAWLSASRSAGSTGDALVELLEARIDNVAYRSGWAGSRAAARQLVTHGHVLVNGRRLDRPSARISAGDVLSLDAPPFLAAQAERLASAGARLPPWLRRRGGESRPEVEVIEKPGAEDASVAGDIRRVVEYYAR